MKVLPFTENALLRLPCFGNATVPAEDLLSVGNSYFGLLRQAQHSHHDRAILANALRRRGQTIKGDLTKTYRRIA
jgi:hypothetical protein